LTSLQSLESSRRGAYIDRQLVEATDVRLWRTAPPVERVTSYEHDLAHALRAVARSFVNPPAIGFAAPQLGENCRMIMVLHAGSWRVCLNPELSEQEGAFRSHEQCFSLLGQYRTIERAKSLTVQYRDLKWRLRRERVHGLLAVVYQHETAHLDGNVLGFTSADLLVEGLTARADVV
jgi:peptide deformylase